MPWVTDTPLRSKTNPRIVIPLPVLNFYPPPPTSRSSNFLLPPLRIGRNMRCKLIQKRSTGKTAVFQTLATYRHWKRYSFGIQISLKYIKLSQKYSSYWYYAILLQNCVTPITSTRLIFLENTFTVGHISQRVQRKALSERPKVLHTRSCCSSNVSR